VLTLALGAPLSEKGRKVARRRIRPGCGIFDGNHPPMALARLYGSLAPK